MKSANERYRICVDFDGVLHRYDSPWVNAHTIPDFPVKGAMEWLSATHQKMDVVIFSTRCKTWRGRRAVRAWLRRFSGPLDWWGHEEKGLRGLHAIKLTHKKIPALVYLDDRAMRFEGTFPTVDEIHKAKPWNKKEAKP